MCLVLPLPDNHVIVPWPFASGTQWDGLFIIGAPRAVVPAFAVPNVVSRHVVDAIIGPGASRKAGARPIMEVANTSSRATRMRFLVMFEFLSLFFMILLSG